MLVDALSQCGVKRLAAVKGLVVQRFGGAHTQLPRQPQASRTGAVADDGHHARAQCVGPALPLRSPHNGCHIGAAAGDQNHDVLHLPGIILP